MMVKCWAKQPGDPCGWVAAEHKDLVMLVLMIMKAFSSLSNSLIPSPTRFARHENKAGMLLGRSLILSRM